jgi:Phosphatidyl serine synthase
LLGGDKVQPAAARRPTGPSHHSPDAYVMTAPASCAPKSRPRLQPIQFVPPFVAIVAALVAVVIFGVASSFRTATCALALFLTSAHPSPPRVFLALLSVAATIYVLTLLVAAAFPPALVTSALRTVDPTHTGAPLPIDMRTADCSLTLSNIAASLDIYAAAHFVGHIVKAVAVRDRRVLLASAAVFEASEWALSSLLPTVFPNLAECAWDRFGLDVALNVAGAELGLALLAEERTRFPARDALLAVVIAAADLSYFAVKAALRVETQSLFPTARICLLGTLAVPAVRQYRDWYHARYVYRPRGGGGRLRSPSLWPGPHMIAVVAVLLSEALLFVTHFVHTPL